MTDTAMAADTSAETLAAHPGLRVFGLALALAGECGTWLTLGLIRPRGETFPVSLPIVGGRPVPVRAAVVPGLLVAAKLTIVVSGRPGRWVMRPFLINVLRAVTYQVLGAALLTPGAAALAVLILRELTPGRLVALWLCCLPASLALAAIPVVQRIELAAAEELLRVVVPGRPDRVGVSVLAACHLFIGATLSAVAVVIVAGIIHSFAVMWKSQPWKPILGFAILLAVLGAMWVCAAVQRHIAARLLRACLHGEIDRLNRQQRLAAELHDSVGHALSVVLVQAMAAQEMAESAPSPATWSAPIRQLVDTARGAQQQLDDLLGVLDEHAERRGPTLAEVARPVTGLEVDYRHDPVDGVVSEISRVAFALAREAVTNAVRHGEPPVRLRITVRDEVVVSTVNRIRSVGDPHSGGRGLAGMRMRAALVGGTCTWWEEGDQWHTRAALPLEAR